MDESNIQGLLIRCLTLVFCTLVGSCSVKDYYSERNMVDAMRAGASAQEARCAIYGTTSSVCAVLAARQK